LCGEKWSTKAAISLKCVKIDEQLLRRAYRYALTDGAILDQGACLNQRRLMSIVELKRTGAESSLVIDIKRKKSVTLKNRP